MAQGKKQILKKRIKGQIRDNLARKVDEKVEHFLKAGGVYLPDWEPTGAGNQELVRRLSVAILLDMANQIAWTDKELKEAKKLIQYL